MPDLVYVDRSGHEHRVRAEPGMSVMETIREAGSDELLALCGGSKSCATCHVYVDDQWLDLLPPMDGDEDDLLDSAAERAANSRLSCQLPLSPALDGLRVTIAPED